MAVGKVRLAPVAVVLLVVASAVAAHYASALTESSHWGAALGIAPFAAAGAAFCWHARRRGLWLTGLGAATVLIGVLWQQLAHNVEWLYLAQHVSMNALLAIGFGATLAAGREPLCTRIARLIHGRLDEPTERYTRAVTLAWTGFFALMVAISLLLFAFAPVAIWSVFANLLTWPLVGLMFVAEYLLRLRVLPQDRSTILDAIRAYRSADPLRRAPASPDR